VTGKKGERSMKRFGWLVIVLAALTSAAPGQKLNWTKEELAAEDRKRHACRFNQQALIGLPRDQLRSRCGIWSGTQSLTTGSGTAEAITYGAAFEGGPFFTVYVQEGRVTAVAGH
jgi:hypothetical protein